MSTASTITHETGLLLRYLNQQREHVLGILEGLSEEDLRRPVLPTGWSCLGLVQHLTYHVEQFWFRVITSGQTLSSPDAWQVSPDQSAAEVFAAYRDEINQANAIIAATALDAPPAYWPAEQFGNWRLDSLRDIILHVITETACHAGHLDAVRELIDGQTWLILA
jgi:uncharacterized damage-inducible protein DinB